METPCSSIRWGGFLDAIGSGWQPGIPLGPAGQAESFQAVTPAPSRHARLRLLGWQLGAQEQRDHLRFAAWPPPPHTQHLAPVSVAILLRRKCLLLSHAATLFSIFEADVSASDLRATSSLVTRLIRRELLAEGLPSSTFTDLEPERVILARTADRSVLGA
jgi:hypothetical protein